MTFNLEHEFSVSISLHSMSHLALHHINEIRRRAGDVMSYTSLFVDREKVEDVILSVMKRHVLH